MTNRQTKNTEPGDGWTVCSTTAGLAGLGKRLDVFGEPAKSNNKDYLRRRIAYRIQELAEGGLSEQAKIRIEEINRDMPLRLSPMPEEARPELPEPRESTTVLEMPTPSAPSQPRDPRLPGQGLL